jgi:hypothetical protein
MVELHAQRLEILPTGKLLAQVCAAELEAGAPQALPPRAALLGP